jgi:hypothetical protein
MLPEDAQVIQDLYYSMMNLKFQNLYKYKTLIIKSIALAIFLDTSYCQSVHENSSENFIDEIKIIDKDFINFSNFKIILNGFKETENEFEISHSDLILEVDGTKKCGMMTTVSRISSSNNQIIFKFRPGEYCGRLRFRYTDIQPFWVTKYTSAEVKFEVKNSIHDGIEGHSKSCEESNLDTNSFICPHLIFQPQQNKILTLTLTDDSHLDLLRTSAVWYGAIMTGVGPIPLFSLFAPLLGFAVIEPKIEVSLSL